MQHMLTCKLERGRPTQLRLLTAACAILAASLILTRTLHFPLGLPFLAGWDSLIAARSTVKLDWQLHHRSDQTKVRDREGFKRDIDLDLNRFSRLQKKAKSSSRNLAEKVTLAF